MFSPIANVVSGVFGGISAEPILAYLDPGSGSMILQVLIAGTLSSLYFMRSSISYMKTWLSGNKNAR
jgi:hypothetical protein